MPRPRAHSSPAAWLRLRMLAAGLASAFAVACAFLAVGLQDSVSAPQQARAAVPAAVPRSAQDAELWAATERVVRGEAEQGGWSPAQTQEVLGALERRHQQVIRTREAIARGDVSPEAGRRALLDLANRVRGTILVAVGPESTGSLDAALAASPLGAGL